MWKELMEEQRKDLLVFTSKYRYDDKFWKSRDVHIDRYVTEVVGELSGGANDQIDECLISL